MVINVGSTEHEEGLGWPASVPEYLDAVASKELPCP